MSKIYILSIKWGLMPEVLTKHNTVKEAYDSLHNELSGVVDSYDWSIYEATLLDAMGE